MIDCIYEYDRHFTSIEFTCDNQEDLELLLPLSYYKGYKAYELISEEYKAVNISSDEKYKLIELDSSKGLHTYKVTYEGTFVQKATLLISTLSFAIIFGYGILKKIILKNDLTVWKRINLLTSYYVYYLLAHAYSVFLIQKFQYLTI